MRSCGRVRVTRRLDGRVWAALDVCDDLCGYYNWLLRRAGEAAEPPSRPHVTFIRNERPPIRGGLPPDGKLVWFEHGTVAETNGRKWWLPVECPELGNMRDKAGLSKRPTFRLHLTIGE